MILIGSSWQDRALPSPLSTRERGFLMARPLKERRQAVLPLGNAHDSLKGRGGASFAALTPVY
jgi:hypothetical protein